MFLRARQAAATLAGRAGRTSTTSTRPRSMGEGESSPIYLRAVKLFRPLPRRLSRLLSVAVVLAWLLQMGVLYRSIQASTASFATDLSHYGSSAQWRGVYSRGDKIGYMVG